MLTIRDHARDLLNKGFEDALFLINLINETAVPELEAEYVFLGYCPGGDLERRLDDIWIADGICKFDFIESKHQHKLFNRIKKPDTIILKKRQEFGSTMRIHAFGKVNKVEESDMTALTYLRVDWIKPRDFLEVPLMGCNSTVNSRTLKQVEDAMPKDFWAWMAEG